MMMVMQIIPEHESACSGRFCGGSLLSAFQKHSRYCVPVYQFTSKTSTWANITDQS